MLIQGLSLMTGASVCPRSCSQFPSGHAELKKLQHCRSTVKELKRQKREDRKTGEACKTGAGYCPGMRGRSWKAPEAQRGGGLSFHSPPHRRQDRTPSSAFWSRNWGADCNDIRYILFCTHLDHLMLEGCLLTLAPQR